MSETPPTPVDFCAGSSKPRVFIGPDVNLQVLCGNTTRGAVASINQTGPGQTGWSVSIAGDPSFFTVPGQTKVCVGQPPAVVDVDFLPPITATPGDAFHAVVTIVADDDAFPTGTVKVHGVVVAPSITADKTVVDFGDLAYGVEARQTITFRSDQTLNITPPPEHLFPFEIVRAPSAAGGSTWTISVSAIDGDYAVDTTWSQRASNDPSIPVACNWSMKVPFRVHVLPFDAGATPPDPGDGGADRASDAAP
jgi:hypothetical protein